MQKEKDQKNNVIEFEGVEYVESPEEEPACCTGCCFLDVDDRCTAMGSEDTKCNMKPVIYKKLSSTIKGTKKRLNL